MFDYACVMFFGFSRGKCASGVFFVSNQNSGTGQTPKIKKSDKGVKDKQNVRIIFFRTFPGLDIQPFDLISDNENFSQNWV